MIKPHEHAEVIKAMADGAQVEFFSKIYGTWETATELRNPFSMKEHKWRIKPSVDLSDARYIFRWKWVDEDVALAMFPNRQSQIRSGVEEATQYIPEGFTPFDGGECPVNPSCIVEILLRNGETNKNNFGYSADLFRWDHTGVEHDIIAYKVIKNAPVVRWQWIYRCFGKLILTERFYASEEEFREHNRAIEIELLKKADWTRTEFDE